MTHKFKTLTLLSTTLMALCAMPLNAQESDRSDAKEAQHGYPVPPPPGPYRTSTPMLPADIDAARKAHEKAMEQHRQRMEAFAKQRRPYPGPGRYWTPGDVEGNEGADAGEQSAAAQPSTPPWGVPPEYDKESATTATPYQGWYGPRWGGWYPPPAPYGYRYPYPPRPMW